MQTWYTTDKAGLTHLWIIDKLFPFSLSLCHSLHIFRLNNVFPCNVMLCTYVPNSLFLICIRSLTSSCLFMLIHFAYYCKKGLYSLINTHDTNINFAFSYILVVNAVLFSCSFSWMFLDRCVFMFTISYWLAAADSLCYLGRYQQHFINLLFNSIPYKIFNLILPSDCGLRHTIVVYYVDFVLLWFDFCFHKNQLGNIYRSNAVGE